jgi:hypothetical protein
MNRKQTLDHLRNQLKSVKKKNVGIRSRIERQINIIENDPTYLKLDPISIKNSIYYMTEIPRETLGQAWDNRKFQRLDHTTFIPYEEVKLAKQRGRQFRSQLRKIAKGKGIK